MELDVPGLDFQFWYSSCHVNTKYVEDRNSWRLLSLPEKQGHITRSEITWGTQSSRRISTYIKNEGVGRTGVPEKSSATVVKSLSYLNHLPIK